MPQKSLHLVAGGDFELPELPGRALPSRSFTETYYDTAGGRLGRAGFMLRRRIENGKGVWHLTVTSDGESALDVEALGGPAAPPVELQELLQAASAGFSLAEVARLSTTTNGKRVKKGRHTLARIRVASVSVLDGHRAADAFHEIRVEPLAAGRKDLGRIEKALRKAGAKPARGRPRIARALRTETLQESPAATPDLERLRMFFREQFARILAHDPGVRLGEDPEELHQLRVATRRLRSVLRTARPVLDADWAQHLRDELSWLADELGLARDVDVLTEHLRAEAAQLDPADRRALKPLFDKLAADGEDARNHVLEALRSERYFALLATLEGAAGAPPAGVGDVSLRKAARKEFKRLAKAMDAVAADPSDMAIHRARIKGKRARYAAELLEDDLGKAGKRLISAAKRFQDVAGEHQDAVVAGERIRSTVRGLRSQSSALAAGLLVARQRDRKRDALANLPKAWKRVDRAAAKVLA